MVHKDPVLEVILNEQAEREVRAEYARGNEDLTPSDRHLLRDNSLESILARDRPLQQLWIDQVRAARHQGNATARRNSSRAIMERWLATHNHLVDANATE